VVLLLFFVCFWVGRGRGGSACLCVCLKLSIFASQELIWILLLSLLAVQLQVHYYLLHIACFLSDLQCCTISGCFPKSGTDPSPSLPPARGYNNFCVLLENPVDMLFSHDLHSSCY